MKINHKLIKNIIMGIGIGIFIISLIYKIRNLILYGGTSVVEDEDNTKDDAEVDMPTTEAPEPVWGNVDAKVQANDENDPNE